MLRNRSGQRPQRQSPAPEGVEADDAIETSAQEKIGQSSSPTGQLGADVLTRRKQELAELLVLLLGLKPLITFTFRLRLVRLFFFLVVRYHETIFQNFVKILFDVIIEQLIIIIIIGRFAPRLRGFVFDLVVVINYIVVVIGGGAVVIVIEGRRRRHSSASCSTSSSLISSSAILPLSPFALVWIDLALARTVAGGAYAH